MAQRADRPHLVPDRVLHRGCSEYRVLLRMADKTRRVNQVTDQVSVADDLLKAADIMEERGKGNGQAVGADGRVCALGAIGMATVPNFEHQSYSYFTMLYDCRQARDAMNAFADYLGATGHALSPSSCDTIWRFSDARRGWGSKKKVVKAFRAAAAEIQEAERKAKLVKAAALCSQVCPASFPLPKVDVTPNPVDRRPVDSLDSQDSPAETMPATPRLTALVGAT